jgi:hypothetical protein
VTENCSAMSVPGMRKFVLRWAPCVRDVPDMGSSWKSFTVLLNLQPHRINADRGGGTGFDREAPVSQSVVLNSISRIMRHHMCDNVQSHSLSPNVCFLRVCGTGAYDLKGRMQGRFTGVTLMEHLRAGIIRHSRDVLMVARWIAHGLNIEA